jgi:hypothetical protein
MAEFGAYALEYVALSETRMPTARLERDKAILGAVDNFLAKVAAAPAIADPQMAPIPR